MKRESPRLPNLPAVMVGAGGRTCIAFKVGRKWCHVVKMGEPIAVDAVAIDASDFHALLAAGAPYPVRKAARRYLASEISKTDRALRILRAIARGRAPAAGRPA